MAGCFGPTLAPVQTGQEACATHAQFLPGPAATGQERALRKGGELLIHPCPSIYRNEGTTERRKREEKAVCEVFSHTQRGSHVQWLRAGLAVSVPGSSWASSPSRPLCLSSFVCEMGHLLLALLGGIRE